MRTVGLFEAKNKLSELAAAESGEEVIITRHGKPVVKLVAVADPEAERTRRHLEAVEDIKRIRATLKHRATIEELIEDKNFGRR